MLNNKNLKGCTIDYFDEGNKTVFLIRTPNYDIVLGSRDSEGYRDIEEAKQVIDKARELMKW